DLPLRYVQLKAILLSQGQVVFQELDVGVPRVDVPVRCPGYELAGEEDKDELDHEEDDGGVVAQDLVHENAEPDEQYEEKDLSLQKHTVERLPLVSLHLLRHDTLPLPPGEVDRALVYLLLERLHHECQVELYALNYSLLRTAGTSDPIYAHIDGHAALDEHAGGLCTAGWVDDRILDEREAVFLPFGFVRERSLGLDILEVDEIQQIDYIIGGSIRLDLLGK
ncbi:MAG: hypothetical protein LUP94_00095, partial [Candidatus Methanomethylicus sp.]|nr:hypothetical protein [Candidatus Methanomethylicus sp.]